MPPASPLPTSRYPVRRWLWVFVACWTVLVSLAGCQGGPSGMAGQPGGGAPIGTPSNDRNWIIEHKVLAQAEMQGDDLTIRNIRDAEFFTYRDCVVDYYDKTFKLSDVRNVDYLVVPFNEQRALAHTMLSFGLADGDRIGVSVEVRLEKGEEYHPLNGALGQFEIMYVVASERDLVRVRVEHRDCDVYAYRGNSTPEQTQALFLDILRRVNKLNTTPEMYDTITNNCTTNIVQHINRLAPGKVPQDYRVLLPGFSDQLAYELKLIDTSLPFEETKSRARLNDQVVKYRDDPHFSARIRGEPIVR